MTARWNTRAPDGQEDLVFDGAAEECGVRADEYSIANLNRVLGGGPDYRVVAHDDLLTERDGLTLGNEARTVPDHTTGSDPDLADECRVRCDDCRGVNVWAMATALQQHWNTTSFSCPCSCAFVDALDVLPTILVHSTAPLARV